MDSHKDTIHVAVIAGTGRLVADHEFPTTETGYRHAVAWLAGHGPLQAVGVEGTSSYGVGICAALTTAGIVVVEVNRTRAAERRKRGKTDPLDAYRAARSVLSGEAGTLTHAAQHFGVWPMHISTIERGKRRDDTLATAYRDWLKAA